MKDGVPVVPADDALARGPGNLGAVLGLDLDLDGATLAVVAGEVGAGGVGDHAAEFTLTPPASPVEYVSGPRIGISKNVDAPLRFWIPGDRSVTSPRGRPKGV